MIVLYYCSGTSSVCVEARGCQSTPSWQSAVVYPGRHSLHSLHSLRSLFSLSWTPSPTSSHLPQCYGKFTFWETDEDWTTDWLNGRWKQKWRILRQQIIRIIDKRCNSLDIAPSVEAVMAQAGESRVGAGGETWDGPPQLETFHSVTALQSSEHHFVNIPRNWGAACELTI